MNGLGRRITPKEGRRMAKARWRRFHEGYEPEPKMVRTTALSFAVRDDISGVVVWHPLKSLRDASRRIAVVLREYRPGLPA